jgi:hypothetical protein
MFSLFSKKESINNQIAKLHPTKRGGISDGYHTFNELYNFRLVYNACLFNEWARLGLYDVHKSLRHYDGGHCFGGGWFIVSAMLPGGLISNHYDAAEFTTIAGKRVLAWDLFKIPAVAKAKYPFDGHDGNDVLKRLMQL